jgi:hypothetical protein
MGRREVNGKRYIYFPREHEVHDNSFLKTLLEAGVSADQVVMARQQPLHFARCRREAQESLFRFDPEDAHRFDPLLPEEHLPWCLIAFSTAGSTRQPDLEPMRFGEKIDLDLLIDRGHR